MSVNIKFKENQMVDLQFIRFSLLHQFHAKVNSFNEKI